ncbi:hypothetical protein ANO11243_054630 [Dothideomycetidae sp. 11243]|nr:hypothetical protein ANO11243_054630 [fungal sp. No.11243]
MLEMDKILQSSRLDLYFPSFKATLVKTGLNERTIQNISNILKHHQSDHKESHLATRVQTAELSLEDLASRVTTSVARYLERQNLDLVEASWDAVRTRLDCLSEDERKSPSLHRIYEEFLLTFRALRRADYTLEVWNHMITRGCRPTVRTWNVMLKGCHVGKEVDAMEDVWRRMIKAGIQPNAHSWGIRIHGLFQFHKLSEGYRALAEMTEAAKYASLRGAKIEEQDDAPPKPDVVILNSALSGVARHGAAPVRKLLGWASGQQIKFDIITYNILINVALHTGQKEDARRIMQKMAADGINPDSATFTILLHSMFNDGFLSDLDLPEQEKHAMDFIHSLEKDGLNLDVRGYALLLDRLLKKCQNVQASRKVLDHMIKRGIEPTAHMYTILMTHFFSLDPPDIDSVESLWERIRSNTNYVVDVIFYDRMLEGFARADKVSKMMYFLQRMGQEGKRPGWMALVEVLQSLLRQGDSVRARELIKDVELSAGNVKAGVPVEQTN